MWFKNENWINIRIWWWWQFRIWRWIFNWTKKWKRKRIWLFESIEYKGEYLYGKKWNGEGFDEKGKIIYILKNGNGKVKEYGDDDGNLEFEGEYLNGQRNGKGKEYDYYGKLKFEGEYLNGQRYEKGREYYDNGKLKFGGEYLNWQKYG